MIYNIMFWERFYFSVILCDFRFRIISYLILNKGLWKILTQSPSWKVYFSSRKYAPQTPVFHCKITKNDDRKILVNSSWHVLSQLSCKTLPTFSYIIFCSGKSEQSKAKNYFIIKNPPGLHPLMKTLQISFIRHGREIRKKISQLQRHLSNYNHFKTNSNHKMLKKEK